MSFLSVVRLYNDDPAYLEWIQQTVKDVSRSFDFLVQERGADPARIGLIGASRGAVVSMIAGSVDERFRAVALLHGGHFDFFEDEHRAAACPANYIGHIERPVLSSYWLVCPTSASSGPPTTGTVDAGADGAVVLDPDPLHRWLPRDIGADPSRQGATQPRS